MDDITNFKCVKAHVYKDKNELFIDYWGVNEFNPKIKIHIPRMGLGIENMRVIANRNPFQGICVAEKQCYISDNKNTLFEIIVDDKPATKRKKKKR